MPITPDMIIVSPNVFLSYFPKKKVKPSDNKNWLHIILVLVYKRMWFKKPSDGSAISSTRLQNPFCIVMQNCKWHFSLWLCYKLFHPTKAIGSIVLNAFPKQFLGYIYLFRIYYSMAQQSKTGIILKWLSSSKNKTRIAQTNLEFALSPCSRVLLCNLDHM